MVEIPRSDLLILMLGWCLKTEKAVRVLKAGGN
jgi:hypothetical protein